MEEETAAPTEDLEATEEAGDEQLGDGAITNVKSACINCVLTGI
jgi:hypothetical protein